MHIYDKSSWNVSSTICILIYNISPITGFLSIVLFSHESENNNDSIPTKSLVCMNCS